MIATDVPYRQYADTTGLPLDGGYLYFGQPNQNPETAPITVYWDEAGTLPATQPIRTLNGFAVRSGNIANIYCEVDYSLTIKNKVGMIVSYSESSINAGIESHLKSIYAAPSGASLVGSAAWYAATITGFDASSVPNGATVVFRGRDAVEDGGGGVFSYAKTGTQTVDSGLVFAPTGGGRLLRNGWSVVGFNGPVNPQWFGCIGDGATDDYANMVKADVAAAAAGAALEIAAGCFKLNTSYAFTAPVMVLGGIFTGSGTVSFPVGFAAAPYYCFDCLVGYIRAESVYAEWFGARQTAATPTSTGQDISAKSWNVWPSFITGAGYGVNQNYGNGAYLSANKPFSNSDTWDFIAIQRALWALGSVNTGYRGEVRLLAGTYTLTRAVRWVGNMASTLRGACRTKTLLAYSNINTNEVIVVSSGNCTSLLHCYATGPDPIFIADLAAAGPSGYSFGNPIKVYPVSMSLANGVTLANCWITTGDACIYMDQSTSDLWIRECMFEYGSKQVYGFDAGSWCQIANSGFWWSVGTVQTGLNIAGYAFVNGCTFASLDVPYQLGLGSNVSATTLIQRTTGYRTLVNGRTITRHLKISAGTTGSILTMTMASTSALTTRLRAGGFIQGVGAVGLLRELSWYRDGAAPVAAVLTATAKWGNAGAQALLGELTASGGANVTLQLTNAGAAGQDFEGDITVTIEGNDFIISGLA